MLYYGYTMANEETLVRMKIKTTNRLKTLKATPRESYDEIINRILDHVWKNKKIK